MAGDIFDRLESDIMGFSGSRLNRRKKSALIDLTRSKMSAYPGSAEDILSHAYDTLSGFSGRPDNRSLTGLANLSSGLSRRYGIMRRNPFGPRDDNEEEIIGGEYHEGGKVPGTGDGDKVHIMAEPGEYVIPKHIVQKFGKRFFDELKEGKMPTMRKMQTGGYVSPDDNVRRIRTMIDRGLNPEPIAPSGNIFMKDWLDNSIRNISPKLPFAAGAEPPASPATGDIAPRGYGIGGQRKKKPAAPAAPPVSDTDKTWLKNWEADDSGLAGTIQNAAGTTGFNKDEQTFPVSQDEAGAFAENVNKAEDIRKRLGVGTPMPVIHIGSDVVPGGLTPEESLKQQAVINARNRIMKKEDVFDQYGHKVGVREIPDYAAREGAKLKAAEEADKTAEATEKNKIDRMRAESEGLWRRAEAGKAGAETEARRLETKLMGQYGVGGKETSQVKNYRAYAAMEREAGREPLPMLEWSQKFGKKADQDAAVNAIIESLSGKKGNEAPPVAGARKAPDGHWYVKQNGQTYRVE